MAFQFIPVPYPLVAMLRRRRTSRLPPTFAALVLLLAPGARLRVSMWYPLQARMPGRRIGADQEPPADHRLRSCHHSHIPGESPQWILSQLSVSWPIINWKPIRTEPGNLLCCPPDHSVRQERQHPSHEHEPEKEAAAVLAPDHTGQEARHALAHQSIPFSTRAAGFKNCSALGHAQMTDD